MSHARGTFAALVDAVIPETPELAAGADTADQTPGGLAAGTHDRVLSAVNGFIEVEDGPLAWFGYDAVPLGPVVALLFELAAVELLLRGETAGLQPPETAFSVGAFSRLSRRDRLRALRLLEDGGVLPALAGRFDVTGLHTVAYLAGAVVTLVEFDYYSGEQARDQVGYPGPADGYAVSLGYELDAFEEDDY